MPKLPATLPALTLALLLCTPGAPASDEEVDVGSLPPKVVEAIQARYPHGKLLQAERETERRKVQYDVKVLHDGKTYDVEVTADGRILEAGLDDGED